MERMVKEIVKPELDEKINDAQKDSKSYARKNNSWVEVQVGGGSGGASVVWLQVEYEGADEYEYGITDYSKVKEAWDNGDFCVVEVNAVLKYQNRVYVGAKEWLQVVAYIPSIKSGRYQGHAGIQVSDMVNGYNYIVVDNGHIVQK